MSYEKSSRKESLKKNTGLRQNYSNYEHRKKDPDLHSGINTRRSDEQSRSEKMTYRMQLRASYREFEYNA